MKFEMTPERRQQIDHARVSLMTKTRVKAAKAPTELKRAIEVCRAAYHLGLLKGPEDLDLSGPVIQADDWHWDQP